VTASRRRSPGQSSGQAPATSRPAAATLKPALPPDPADGEGVGPAADPYAVARTIALRHLTAAPRTRAQLAAALRRREVPDRVAEAVLDRLGEVSLIDDQAFAERWVSSRHSGRGLARRALGAELRERGVAPEVAEAALCGVDEERELQTARALVLRRLPATRGLDRERRTRRLVQMLARRGYPAATALRAVREALDGEDADASGGSAGGEGSDDGPGDGWDDVP
jgi:regulatory protein